MLTAYQCEIVGFVTDGSIICHDCGVSRLKSLTSATDLGIEKWERGLDTPVARWADEIELRPLIRYSLDEYLRETAWEYACQEHEEGTPEFDALFERCSASHPCDDCGKEMS